MVNLADWLKSNMHRHQHKIKESSTVHDKSLINIAALGRSSHFMQYSLVPKVANVAVCGEFYRQALSDRKLTCFIRRDAMHFGIGVALWRY